MRFRTRFYFVLLLTVLLSGATFAQSIYGTIKGALTMKAGGEPVPKALVLLSSLDRGDLLIFSAQTDNSGYFIFSNLPAGAYSLRTQKDGCKTFEEPIVPVVADTASEVDVKLTPGTTTEKEVDNGSAISILKLDRTDVATSFSLPEIQALPIYLQNISLYELLVPGATPVRPVLPTQQNPQNGVYASLSGQHFSGTEVVVDGTVDRDPLEAIAVLNPSLDSVSELKITTQNYSAEFGPATGGVVSIQTRSGTNELHGSAFGYRLSGFGQASVPTFGESSSLQASSNKRNDFGATLGGAPIRDRLFLFGDYRGIRTSQDGTVLLTVPTGTVHETCTGSKDPNAPPCDITAYVNAGANCFSPCGLNTNNGEILNTYVSPQMVYFLNLIPRPNHGSPAALTNNFTASGVDSFRNDNFDVRADYVVSNKFRTFTRYSFADFRENGTPAFGAAVGGLGTNPATFAGTMNDRNQGISAGFSLNLSSSLLTDFRFGFFRYHLGLDSLDRGTTPWLAIPNNPVAGLNLVGDLYTSGMPDIVLDDPKLAPIAGGLDFLRIGYSPVVNSCDCPLREREQQFQFVNNWTKLVGKHNIRWGADFRYLQNFRLSSDSRPAGQLDFQNAQNSQGSGTGFSLGDFLIGTGASFQRSYANPGNPVALNAGERQKRLFFYGEDTWRISSRLTFNYGLRWEIYLPQSVTGTGAGGWLQLGSGATPVQDRFLVAGVGGTNLQGSVKTTLNNFGPRFGLAYLVNPTTVIRAGYARMFDPGYAGTIFGIAATQSPPVSVVDTIQRGFTLNSNTVSLPNGLPPNVSGYNVCVTGGCTVPAFTFPASPFTVEDLYCDNAPSGTPNCSNSNAPILQQANLYALPRRLRLPTVDGWNVAIQEALDRHTYLEIAYVGNKGTHVLNDSTGKAQVPFYDLNQPPQAGLIGLPETKSPKGATNCQDANDIRANKYTYCKTLDSTRTMFKPLTAQVRYFGDDASSSYNSMQLKLRRQFSSGFSLLANYTWSKIIDFDNLDYAFAPEVSRGVGNFDRKHNFVMTNIWDLPVGRGKTFLGNVGSSLNRFVGGWSIAAITSWSSGLPFTPTYSNCGVDVGSSKYRVCRPNLVGPIDITGNRSQYFTTTGGSELKANCILKDPVSGNFSLFDPCPDGTPPALQGFNPANANISGIPKGAPIPGQTIGPWQRPGAGQIGNAGRNSLRGPGFFQTDLALAKNIKVTERVVVQFRADAFNIFNRVNLANPNTNVDGVSGGQITSITFGAIPRQLQFSLRVNF